MKGGEPYDFGRLMLGGLGVYVGGPRVFNRGHVLEILAYE